MDSAGPAGRIEPREIAHLPVRIYQLAKEFKLDSKDMVDRCAKAGVSGKGSALASLTDEEEVKVRAFLTGGTSRAVGASGGGRSGGVATLAPPAKSGPLTPSDYIPPGGMTGKPPAIPSKSDGERTTAETPKKSGGDGAKPPTRPAIRVAAMPTAQQPPAPAKPQEPAPQKPD
ncbi:MAG: hypothetical protein ACREJM_13620, partial [Candidatus Saccharimonadales bacterium]